MHCHVIHNLRPGTTFKMTVPEEKFGYSIYIDGQIYVEQKTIPAIEGNIGFASQYDAEKVAKKVIDKMRQGDLPPSVSVEELEELSIHY